MIVTVIRIIGFINGILKKLCCREGTAHTPFAFRLHETTQQVPLYAVLFFANEGFVNGVVYKMSSTGHFVEDIHDNSSNGASTYRFYQGRC